MNQAEIDLWHVRRALELARTGQGYVEPNPMVGCVVVRGAEIIGEGWHRRFGGPHAEAEALRLAGSRAKGATLYVTLEPDFSAGGSQKTDCSFRINVLQFDLSARSFSRKRGLWSRKKSLKME